MRTVRVIKAEFEEASKTAHPRSKCVKCNKTDQNYLTKHKTSCIYYFQQILHYQYKISYRANLAEFVHF